MPSFSLYFKYAFISLHQESSLLASTTKSWNTRIDLIWEAYAAKRSGANGLDKVSDYLTHFDSLPSRGCCTIHTHDGRVSYFKNDALKIFTISFRGTNNVENAINDLWLGREDITKLKETMTSEKIALKQNAWTPGTELTEEQITDLSKAKIQDANISEATKRKVSEIFTRRGFTPIEMSAFANALNRIHLPSIFDTLDSTIPVNERMTRKAHRLISHAFSSASTRFTPEKISELSTSLLTVKASNIKTKTQRFELAHRIIFSIFQDKFTSEEKERVRGMLQRVLKTDIPYDFQSFEMHKGFAYEYRQLRADIYHKLENEFFPLAVCNWRILITGHSLGGAMATLCTADLLMNKVAPASHIALITLGSPRAVNYDFARWIDSQGLFKNIRVEYENDFFTSVPAQNNGAFWHRGKRTHLTINADSHDRTVASTYGEEKWHCETSWQLSFYCSKSNRWDRSCYFSNYNKHHRRCDRSRWQYSNFRP